MRLTPLEIKIVRHRLDVPECIAEALDEDADYIALICSQLAELIHGALDDIQLENCLDPIMASEILAECVEGSTYCGASQSAADDGEISQGTHRATQRAAESLAAKIGKLVGRELRAVTC